MTPRTSALIQQSSSHLANDTTYGDGIRCTAGARLKLALRRTASGSARYPDVNDPSISARSAQLGDPLAPGMVRYYSVLYRDPNLAFCPTPPGGTFNLTNVIRVAW
jgi:hypothetical protein